MQHLVTAATVSSKVTDNYWNMLAFNASNHYYLQTRRYVLNQSIALYAFPYAEYCIQVSIGHLNVVTGVIYEQSI